MLFDIFYSDRSFDRARDLPDRAEDGAYALNVDFDGRAYVAVDGQWVPGSRDAAGKIVPKK